MRFKTYLIFQIALAVSIHRSYGCQMDNVENWRLPQALQILDVDRGDIFSSPTSNIIGISSVTFVSLLQGPYLDVTYSDSQFVVKTNQQFDDYEENETSLSIDFTVVFNCVGGTTQSLVFTIGITDTNNHEPEFRPNATGFEFTVMPPLPPGFQINLLNQMFARDVDLTNYRIDFEIYDSPNFAIAYDSSTSVPKEFSASLTTTTLIRSIPEPIEFRISATDVDNTGDPRLTTYATVRIKSSGEFELPDEPVFSQTFYLATYTENHQVLLQEPITLQQGYHAEVEFSLSPEYLQYFSLDINENDISIKVIKQLPADLLALSQLLLVVKATRENTSGASATIVLQLPEVKSLQFQQLNFEGTIVDNVLQLPELILAQGYESETVTVEIKSEHASYFGYTIQQNIIILTMTPLASTIIEQNNFLNLQVVASNSRSSASTIVTLEIVKDDGVTPVFQRALYEGTYDPDSGLTLDQIVLVQGYDSTVQLKLIGEHQALFQMQENGPNVNLVTSGIPSELFRESNILLTLEATKPRTVGANTVISIALPADTVNDSSVAFEKVLFNGIIQSNVVQHETITLRGYQGTTINIVGVYGSMFQATLTGEVVVVQAAGPLTLPEDVRHVVLELGASDARAVLILEVSATEGPLPVVIFDSATYVVRVRMDQTGQVGRVHAAANNGEAVTYSLLVPDDHLRSRISINNAGELSLSAPANSGIHSFTVVATTVYSEATGLAMVLFSVEALTVCGDDTVTPPLIVLDRDEEQPLRDLVLLNTTEHVGCQYSLTNRWPTEQEWLYVDETGLHATAIDREDPSIAFMALSQVQVELTLTCDSDVTRTRRSVDERLDWLGPYDYGTNTWLLGDTILFNPRRSIVNLIVNDINDNAPVFIGKDSEPIIVGYPIRELEETVLPRSLVELQATDADVGENAALVYWSTEPELAVSPTTGFVHVRNEQRLEHDKTLTVSVTDQNGQGLTGSISLMVKLLESRNIAVVTVRNAFLEDESRVLGNISNVIGYEVRSLRSVVVSETEGEAGKTNRVKRELTTSGASLELYVYGFDQKEPVTVERLTTDINNADTAIVAVDIARILSLEDHLEGLLICENPGRDAGLFAATIALSVLLFILIVAIIVWYILTRRKKENYEQFSDANSLASRTESLGQPAKPLDNVMVSKPRLNIEDLKRSERRLQDMLNAPIEEVTIEPSTTKDNTINAVTKIPDPIAPIVIQDKLKDVESSDDDEFGERKKPRRKSVVTFNENVEKIIHVEEPEPIDSNYEVYKL